MNFDNLKNPKLFIPNLKIRNKEGNIIPFKDVITQEQKNIINIFQSHDRIAVIKARQLGASTIFRALFFHLGFTSRRSLQLGVFSNKARSANALLDIDKRFYNTLPSELQREASIKRNEITFESTQTKLTAFSAQSDSNDRGYSLQGAHLSEFAFYENADETLASVIASTNKSKVVIESTPNYYGDALHKIAMDAQYNKSWKVIVAPWYNFPQYAARLPRGGYELTREEEILFEEGTLDKRQILWRRQKIEELKSLALFNREYPTSLEEAYSLGSNSFLSDTGLKTIELWDRLNYNNDLKIYSEYDGTNRYAIGFDPAGGCGKDYSVAIVVDKLTLSIAAVLSCNETSIKSFSEQVIQLSQAYKATVLMELNNHGSGVKEVFDSFNFNNYRSFQTNVRSKQGLLDNLKSLIEDGSLGKVDDLTMVELRGLVVNKRGRVAGASGVHDDRAIALALALSQAAQVRTPESPYQSFFKPPIKKNFGPLLKRKKRMKRRK